MGAHFLSILLSNWFTSRLRPIDVEFMKRLGKIVSIVPVIAKADTLTIEERHEFKERVRDTHTHTHHVLQMMFDLQWVRSCMCYALIFPASTSNL